MNRVRRRRRSASQRSKLLEQWSESGESAEQFAARIGVKASTLATWRKAAGKDASRAGSTHDETTRKASGESMFARVQVVEPVTRGEGLVEIVLRDGVLLRIHGAVSAETLSTVVGALSRC